MFAAVIAANALRLRVHTGVRSLAAWFEIP